MIKNIFFEQKERYGYRRITAALKRKGIIISRHTVARIMKKNGWRVKRISKLKQQTTDSRHSYRYCPNLLGRQFVATRPNQVWVSDITYLKVGYYWRYLTIIMDLYSRQIVGWSLSSRLYTNFTIIPAWKMALDKTNGYSPEYFHSDRGVQYASTIFKKQLKLTTKTVVQSMSSKGNCLDNANAESFFKTFKYELADYFEDDLTADWDIRRFIDWYNEERLHSALGYIAPIHYKKTLK